MGESVDWESVPLERLEVELTSLAAHLAAAEAQWLAWLAVYDRREGWSTWECRSAAHWLNWKCGMSLPAAFEKVRVARALEGLPVTREAFATGELTYSKVRAITRVANVDCEADLLEMGRAATAAQIERICGGLRRARTYADGEPEGSAWEKQYVSSRHNHDGTATLTACLTTDAMKLVGAAIDAKVDELIADGSSSSGLSRREVIDQRGGVAAMRAQALTEIVVDGGAEVVVTATVPIDSLTDTDTDTDTRTDAEIDNLTDIDTLTDTDPAIATDGENVGGVTRGGGESSGAHDAAHINGSELSRRVAQRLVCDARIDVAAVLADGSVRSVGRRSRVVPRRMRRALARRDRSMCRFPGCAATRNLHAHHVVHWANGGATELDNLILLCPFHHHAVHDGGWSFRAEVAGGFVLCNPAGEPVERGVFRGRLVDFYWHTREQHIDHQTVYPPSYDRVQDLSWITCAVLHNEQLRCERRQTSEQRPSPQPVPA